MKLLKLLLLTPLALAQSPTFQADTRVVEVTVVATDSGDSPVANLRKSDLRLFDNGLEQTIASFEKIGSVGAAVNPDAATAGSTGRQAKGRSAPRLSIILLDALNTSRSDQIYGRKAISEMLRSLPQGEDRIAIFALGEELHLLHGFTTSTPSLRAAVDGYEGEQPYFGIIGAGHFTEKFSLTGPANEASTPDSSKFGDQRLAVTLAAFSEIAQNMRDTPGVKNLLWVTAGYPPPEDHRGIQDATRELAASKVMLYPVDARGLMVNALAANLNIASMEEVAEQTGGRAFHDGNNLAAFARAALDDSREGYLLTYTPSHYKQDGSTHQLQLKTSRKGINLRYRPGYLADSPAR